MQLRRLEDSRRFPCVGGAVQQHSNTYALWDNRTAALETDQLGGFFRKPQCMTSGAVAACLRKLQWWQSGGRARPKTFAALCNRTAAPAFGGDQTGLVSDVQTQRSQSARKLARRSLPAVVMMLSGWNCTPVMGNSRWRMPCTTPSSEWATACSSPGKCTVANEW